MDKKYKSIFTPYVARRLLRMGNPIYDIKPDKTNYDKTIFIFEITEKLINDIEVASIHNKD